MVSEEHTDRRAVGHGLAVFLLFLTLYLSLPAYSISGDGIKYLYMCGSNKLVFEPGHLLYCPLMTLLGRVSEAVVPAGPSDHTARLARLMLLCNQVSGAAGVFLLYRIAAVLGLNPFGRWLSAAGLALSYGYWIQATDIETYAIATMAVVVNLWMMALIVRDGGSLWRPALLGFLNGLAALFHLTSLALIPASLALLVLEARNRRSRSIPSLAAYLVAVSTTLAVPVLTIAVGSLGLDSPGAVLKWLKSADHAYSVQFDALTIPRAMYGFERSFLYLEFFWEAPLWRVAIKGLAFLAAGLWLVSGLRHLSRPSVPAATFWKSLLLFLIPQAAFGIYYFGSDTERWVLVLPILWLAVADVVSRMSPARRKLAVAALAVMALVNTAQAYWPSSADSSIEARVLALKKVLPKNALVITPGNDWLSYYHYYTSERIDKLTLTEVAEQSGRDPTEFYERMGRVLDDRLARGGPVVLLRVLDESDNDRTDPWQVLSGYGLPPAKVRDWFRRYPWVERRLDDPPRTRADWLLSRRTASSGKNG